MIESLLTIQNLKVFLALFPPPKYKNTNTDTNTKDNFSNDKHKDKKITSHFSLGSWLPIWRFVVHLPKCANVQMWHVRNWTWHDMTFFCKCDVSMMWHVKMDTIPFFMQKWTQCFFPLLWPKYFSCKSGHNAFFHCYGQNIFPIAFANVPRQSLSSWYQQSTFAHVLKWWGLIGLYILSLFDVTSVTVHLLICC